MSGDGRRSVYDKKPQNVTPKTTEQNLIVCSDEPEAKVTNNKSTCAQDIVLKLTRPTDRHEAARGLSATAELLVFQTLEVATIAAGNQVCSQYSRLFRSSINILHGVMSNVVFFLDLKQQQPLR